MKRDETKVLTAIVELGGHALAIDVAEDPDESGSWCAVATEYIGPIEKFAASDGGNAMLCGERRGLAFGVSMRVALEAGEAYAAEWEKNPGARRAVVLPLSANPRCETCGKPWERPAPESKIPGTALCAKCNLLPVHSHNLDPDGFCVCCRSVQHVIDDYLSAHPELAEHAARLGLTTSLPIRGEVPKCSACGEGSPVKGHPDGYCDACILDRRS